MRGAWWRSSLSGVLAGFMVGAVAVGACTPSGPRDAAQVVADPGLQQILQHIPADTPYAFIGMGSKDHGAREFITRIYAPFQKLMPKLEEKLGTLGNLGLPAEQAALVSLLQRLVRTRLNARGVVVECNPTSNLLIGGFPSYGALPYPHLHPLDRTGGCLALSINSDDPGIFLSWVRNEYTMLGEQWIRHSLATPDMIRAWLDHARLVGLRSSFVPVGQPYLRLAARLSRGAP